MGCASSAHMTPATGDTLLKPSKDTAINSIPTGEVVLKDLPEVVEKVIDVLKETDSEIAHGFTKDDGSLHLVDSKVDNWTKEIGDSKIIYDTDSESSPQGIVHGFFTDNVSNNSKQSLREGVEKLYSSEKGSPMASADADSLRTSSPESEIEEALANSNDQNPPTPKPTFSELQDLAMLPMNIITSSVKPENDSISLVIDNTKLNNCSNKPGNNIPIVLKHPTEWEKQADMLASTQKFNPIEAMRKLRKQNRSSSSLPHRGDFKPQSQRYFEEDLTDFVPMESPLRSNLCSAKSERSMKANSSEAHANGCIATVQSDVVIKKAQEVKILKKPPPDNKRKEKKLLVSQNGRGAPSPSLYKVRERCAVCCNKYKH